MIVLGIDPAPVKPTVAFDGTDFDVIEPASLRPWVEGRLAADPNTLIAWDAPLAFDHAYSFYTRPVDKLLADLARSEPAVNTAPFGNLSHWSITCHVLGHPFGDPPHGLRLVDAMPREPADPLVIEVHPAFALFQWWQRAGREDEVPPYKRGGRLQRLAAVGTLLEVVGNELRALAPLTEALAARIAGPDDLLDAVVAWEVGMRFEAGMTATVGDVSSGFIVLPQGVQSSK